jgi:DNA-binding NtrC family response regulator
MEQPLLHEWQIRMHERWRQESTPAQNEVSGVRMVGGSDAMRRVEREALAAARREAHVLITGARGVGKAVMARFIHHHSDRATHGFAMVNCEGLPELLAESELFGHVRGSFAGAYGDKPGLLETVPGGTVFLGEVGALSLRMQALLLRFLETGEFRRVGSALVRTALDVRLIASTTANLPGRVIAGLFLDDLYARLNAVCLAVPPLSDRRDDIPSLVDHFVGQFANRNVQFQTAAAEISHEAWAALCRGEWPGNVRELRRVVLRHLLNASTRGQHS